MKSWFQLSFAALLIVSLTACDAPQDDVAEFSGAENEVRIMTLNPGHFHAALVQMNMIDQVDPTVTVFAPEGPDLELHLDRIEDFNTREDNPTHWETQVHTGPDYFEQMLDERPGNVMVTAGNNRQKTDYIKRAVEEGIHVLSDKPMAIDQGGWERLVAAFEAAEENDVLLYDIMPERYEITSVLQRRLAQNSELFGNLQEGSPDNPAIVNESVYHLFKEVAGTPLRRPPWYFDVEQQGEGIVDVTTHLVDLSMWGSFPGEAIDYHSDIEMLEASRWPTTVSQEQFENITGQPEFPDYLHDQLEDGVLPLYANGEMFYTLRGHHVQVSVQWNYEAPEGGDDSYLSTVRGTRSDLVIRQGEEQDFKSTLYVEPADGADSEGMQATLDTAVNDLQEDYPGLAYQDHEEGWELIIPDEYYLGHEAHFGKVAEAFFGYLVEGTLPHWEVSNMKSKYFITTQAREMALAADDEEVAARSN